MYKPEDANEMLDILDGFLTRMDAGASHVGGVLSALRGPDGAGSKGTTTVHIRRAAFPLLAAKYDRREGDMGKMPGGWSMEANQSFANLYPVSGEGGVSYHFYGHIHTAMQALMHMHRWPEEVWG